MTGRRCEHRSSVQRSVALNGRGRRPVLAELTVIPRRCRAEPSTTGRTSFKETDKSESPSYWCESRPVPGSFLTYLTYPIADEPFVTKTGKRMMDPEGRAGLVTLASSMFSRYLKESQFQPRISSDLFDAITRQL